MSDPQPAPILEAIERFLTETRTDPTTFGKRALGDPRFVFDLRKGRRLWPETEAKVRAYMANAQTEAA